MSTSTIGHRQIRIMSAAEAAADLVAQYGDDPVADEIRPFYDQVPANQVHALVTVHLQANTSLDPGRLGHAVRAQLAYQQHATAERNRQSAEAAARALRCPCCGAASRSRSVRTGLCQRCETVLNHQVTEAYASEHVPNGPDRRTAVAAFLNSDSPYRRHWPQLTTSD